MSDGRLRRLQQYARMESPIDPDTLAEAVSAMCVQDGAPLTPPEAALAHEILTQIYRVVHADVRRLLAERFAARPDAPRALVLALANDAIDIARPVIRLSPVLGDEDLVRIVVDSSPEHRIAVTERPALSARLCDVLVYLGDPAIAVRVAAHPQAAISAHALQRLVLASRDTPALQSLVLHRPEMRDDLATAMYHWVAEDLKAYIAENYGEALARHLGSDVDAAAGTASRTGTVPTTMSQFIAALRRDDLVGAERELKRLCRLPDFAVSRLMYHDNGEGLAVLCRSAGVDQATFGDVFALLNAKGPRATFNASPAYRAALAYYHRLTTKQADLVLDGWRASPRSVWGDPARTNAAFARRHEAAKA